MTHLPGELNSLYGVKTGSNIPVMLAGGKFFDPVTEKVSFEVPDGGALVYPVREQDN